MVPTVPSIAGGDERRTGKEQLRVVV